MKTKKWFVLVVLFVITTTWRNLLGFTPIMDCVYGNCNLLQTLSMIVNLFETFIYLTSAGFLFLELLKFLPRKLE